VTGLEVDVGLLEAATAPSVCEAIGQQEVHKNQSGRRTQPLDGSAIVLCSERVQFLSCCMRDYYLSPVGGPTSVGFGCCEGVHSMFVVVAFDVKPKMSIHISDFIIQSRKITGL
jgi:hypothetical protein